MTHFKILSLALATALLLHACGSHKSETTMTKAIDPTNMDLNTRAGDNFFEYVNGSWIKNNPIPAEYSQYGAFTVIYEDNQEQLKSLVAEVSAATDAKAGSVNQQIRDFYNSGMDSVQIESLGTDAIKPQMDAITNLSNHREVQAYVAEMHKHSVYPLFYLFSSADQKNSSMEIANLYQGGLGLPDVAYYLNEDEQSIKLRIAYTDHIRKMFVLIGVEESIANEKANTVLAMETALAKRSKSRLERRDPNGNYNRMPLSELQELSPEFDWQLYFETVGLPEPGEINVSQTDFIASISDMMTTYDVEAWKTYLSWNMLDASANYLNDAIVEQNFDFFSRTLSGKEEMQPRWKRVLGTTSRGLGEALGQLYVEKHFPQESKDRMLVLVENLRLAFADRISKLDWMTDETKEKALEKLNRITVKVGYPDKWKDYSRLQIVPGNYLQNVLAANRFSFEEDLAKVGKEVDETEWGMTPQTVNAYYNPTNNEIVFPAGILQPPFFNRDADDAVNYGSIGVVIGHEMTHGFDDKGRQYDKDGNLNDWWTDEDAERFAEKTAKLVEQYNNYSILDSLHVDGQLTLGENIADLGGINIAFDAMLRSFDGKTPEDIDGFSAEQRFFLGYAQIWRQNIRDKELARRLKEDVHSPGDARVNVPPFNVDAFIAAFHISPEDKLYIPKEKRAYIW